MRSFSWRCSYGDSAFLLGYFYGLQYLKSTFQVLEKHFIGYTSEDETFGLKHFLA